MKVNITKNVVIGTIVFILGLMMLWLIVYRTRLFQIEKEVEDMGYVDEYENSSTGLDFGVVQSSMVVINDSEFTLEEVNDMEDVPTIVSVHVTYEDGTEDTKSAYVVYDDIDAPVFKDGMYGKVILPMREDMGSDEESSGSQG